MGKLLALSLTVSLIGIFLLLLISLNQSPVDITGKAISEDYVSAEGKIISVKTIQDFTIINLDTNITLTCFQCSFKEGDYIHVEGTVEEYQGKKQINTEKIEKIK